MIYAYIIAALAIFGAGFSLSHQIDSAEILAMENKIAKQKTDAATQLAQETDKVNAANLAAINLNSQLDKAHEQNISTINALHDQLGAERLRVPVSRASGRCAATASADPGKPEGETDSAELSTEFSGFLKSRFYEADRAAEYAGECYRFVVEQNCGITVNQIAAQ